MQYGCQSNDIIENFLFDLFENNKETFPNARLKAGLLESSLF